MSSLDAVTADRANRPAPDISVLVATHRRPALLEGTLRSLGAMDTAGIEWELLIVDNAPLAGSRVVVPDPELRARTRVLVESTPGKNRALNAGLREVRGGLVVFTDDDVIVERGWLRELWNGAGRWPEADVFGGRVLPRWPAGATPPREHPFHGHAYAIADFDRPEGPYSSGYVYGPSMAVRRAVFDAGWRFDPGIGPDGTRRYITGSETSLTVALERAGRGSIYLPRAVVYHQIRSEQLTSRWLHGRAFRKGRAEALKQRLAPGESGTVPETLRATARREYAAWQTCRSSGDEDRAFDHALNYWMTRGMIYQLRYTSRVGPPAD